MIKIKASMDANMDIHVSSTDIHASCMDIRANEAWILGPGEFEAGYENWIKGPTQSLRTTFPTQQIDVCRPFSKLKDV